jgi:hypothetical protein
VIQERREGEEMKISNQKAEKIIERTIGMGFGIIYILVGLLALIRISWYYLIGCVIIHITCYTLPNVSIGKANK